MNRRQAFLLILAISITVFAFDKAMSFTITLTDKPWERLRADQGVATTVRRAELTEPPCLSTTKPQTKRQPLFNWTPCRQDTWNRMYADYLKNSAEPPTLGGKWFKWIKESADCNCRYPDNALG